MTTRPKSFSRQLAFAYAALFCAVFVSAAFYTSRAVEHHTLFQLRESLTLQARLLQHLLTPALVREGDRSKIHHRTLTLGQETGARITVIDPEGLVLGDSERTWEQLLAIDNHAGRPEVQTALQGQIGTSIRFSNTVKAKMLYVALPLMEGEKVSGVLRIAWPLTDVRRVLDAVEKPVLLSCAAGVFFAVLLSFILGRSLTRDIRRLTEAAEQYSRGDLGREILVQSDNEIKVLAGTMTQMALSLRQRIFESESEKVKFSAVLENMKEGVIAVDCANRIMVMNPGAQQMFGISKESALGRPLIEVIRNKALDDLLAGVVKDQTTAAREVELSQPAAKIFKVSAAGISKCEGGICGILVLFDMTEIRRLENIRKEFVANVSHELKTPLTSIQGFIETLRGGALRDSKKSEEFLAMMQEDAERLSRLIQDLLELSRIESRAVPLRGRMLDLKPEVEKAVAVLAGQAGALGVVIENRVSADCSVWADHDRLRQMLVNLLDNAIKFNRPGGRVSIFDGRELDLVRVSVEDTGVGIPENMIARVFERFFRVDKARSRELGGTGLGLAIVKHLVEAHGGTVSCRSEFEKGSVFSFTLRTSPFEPLA